MKKSFHLVRLMRGILLKYMPGMISCTEVEQFIDDYLDHSLSPAEVIVFERHLILCSECRAYLTAYQKTIEMGKKALSIDLSDTSKAQDIPVELIAAIKAAKLQHTL